MENEKRLHWWECTLYVLFGIGCLIALACVLYVLFVVPLPATTIYTH